MGGFFSGMLFSDHKAQEERMEMAKQQDKQSSPAREEKKPSKGQDDEMPPSKVLMGYVQDFRDPATVDYSNLTHAIFSFAHPAKDGTLLLNGENALTNLRAMVQRAHQQKTQAVLAVGGWYHIQGGESYEYFKTAIENPASRTKLTNELIGIAEREKLDGIDIDFEHPRSQEDAENLALFVKGLSEKLHAKNKELSIAVYSKIHSVTGKEVTSVIFEPSMFKYVDHVNIMAYDGQWDGGYNAANLSPLPFTENIVAYWTNLFESHKLPVEKLVLGVPLYAQPEDPSVKQLSYHAIIGHDPANAEKDQVEMNGTTYHYNGETTMKRKTKLALENGFGGMMIWEAGHDAFGTHSLTGAIVEELEQYYIEEKRYATTTND